MNDTEAASRTRLAFIVTITSIVGVLALGISIVALARIDPSHPDARSDAATRVLGSVLPVIGTWVGSILAFYFGKANFEAAGNLAKQLSPIDRLRRIPVKEKMIPRDQMFAKNSPLDAAIIGDVLTELTNANKGDRLPVVTPQWVAQYIIHRSMLSEYLTAKAASKVDVTTLTFANLFTDRPDLKSLFSSSFAVVGQDASLADAHVAMSQTPKCEDVFVTATGSKSEAIIGWVTDNIIQANLQTQ
jgi:hypothetical protein